MLKLKCRTISHPDKTASGEVTNVADNEIRNFKDMDELRRDLTEGDYYNTLIECRFGNFLAMKNNINHTRKEKIEK